MIFAQLGVKMFSTTGDYAYLKISNSTSNGDYVSTITYAQAYGDSGWEQRNFLRILQG